jgi:hypothetical protein
MQTLLRSRALWAVHDVDAEAYFGAADFLAQLLEIKILLRNAGFRRPQRPFGWRQLLTHHNNLRIEAQGDEGHSGQNYVRWSK